MSHKKHGATRALASLPVPVDAARKRSQPSAYERAHGAAAPGYGRYASPGESSHARARQSALLRSVHVRAARRAEAEGGQPQR